MVNTLYALKGFYFVQLSAAGESTSISHTAFQVTSLGHQALHALTQERAGFGKQDEEVDREYHSSNEGEMELALFKTFAELSHPLSIYKYLHLSSWLLH